MKKILTILVGFIVLNHFSFGQRTWNQKTSFGGEARAGGSSFTIDGKAYVGLGVNDAGKKLKDIWEYTQLTGAWTKKSDYPGGKIGFATSFSINGKGYVCFGVDSVAKANTDLYEYTPSTDNWVKKASFPSTSRSGTSCFVIGDTAFLIGGSTGGTPYSSEVWMYIPSTDKWIQKADFTGGSRTLGAAFTIGKTGYYGTGLVNSTTASKDMWKYNKSSDIWTAVSNLPSPTRVSAISFVLDNKGYVGAGFDLTKTLNDIYKYDPVANSWSKLDSVPAGFTGRRDAVAFTINNAAYICNGSLGLTRVQELWGYNSKSASINRLSKSDKLNFYPNPVTNTLYIENSTEKEVIASLYNLNGQLLFQQNLQDLDNQINLTNFSNGIYYLKLVSDEMTEMKKIIKQ